MGGRTTVPTRVDDFVKVDDGDEDDFGGGFELTPEEINKLEPVLVPFTERVSIKLGVSVRTVRKEDVEKIEACIAQEEPYCILDREKVHYVLISQTASARDIYRAYIQCYLHRVSVEDILRKIETTGWDLSSLALVSKGYLLELDK